MTFQSSLLALTLGAPLFIATGALAEDCPKGTRVKDAGPPITLEFSCAWKGGPAKGQRHGPYIRYFENGQEREKGTYVDGGKFGTWKYWHATGELAGEIGYLHGKRHGPFRNYSPKGDTLVEGSFFNGKKHGEWRTHKGKAPKAELFQNGVKVTTKTPSFTCPKHSKLKTSQVPERKGSSVKLEQRTCLDESGARHGKTWVLHPIGQPKSEQEFIEGIPDGRYRAWTETGMLKMAGVFKAGKKTGVWQVFSREGTPSAEIAFLDGRKHGKTLRWHDNGRKAEESEYLDGLPDGAFWQWSPAGKLLGTMLLLEGTGTWIRWHDNGEISEQGELVSGRRDGQWKRFKADGWVLETATYRNGRRVSSRR